MQIQEVRNQPNFSGKIIPMLGRKNNFSNAVREICPQLTEFLERKDYNVIFCNNAFNDLHEVIIADATTSKIHRK